MDLLQRTRLTPSRTKGLTSDLSQVAGSASRVQDMLTTMLAYIDDVMVSIEVTVVSVREHTNTPHVYNTIPKMRRYLLLWVFLVVLQLFNYVVIQCLCGDLFEVLKFNANRCFKCCSIRLSLARWRQITVSVVS